jgi:hypothetical protein
MPRRDVDSAAKPIVMVRGWRLESGRQRMSCRTVLAKNAELDAESGWHHVSFMMTLQGPLIDLKKAWIYIESYQILQ